MGESFVKIFLFAGGCRVVFGSACVIYLIVDFLLRVNSTAKKQHGVKNMIRL